MTLYLLASEDYIAVRQFLSFTGTGSVEIVILNDNVSESDENFVVTLTTVDIISGVVDPDTATVTITNGRIHVAKSPI